MEAVTLILATIIALVVLWRFIKPNREKTLLNKMPGPKAYPIVGNLIELLFLKPHEVIPHMIKRRKVEGTITRVWLGSMPIVNISAPEYVELILNSTKEIKKGFQYRLIHQWLGDGLLTSYGAKWAKHRKLITPTFHFKILESFVDIFEAKGKILVKKLENQMEKEQPFDIYPYITRCALDIICETAMGLNLQAQDKLDSKYLAAVYRISRLTSERIVRIYYHSDFIYSLTPHGKENKKCIDTLHSFTESVIRERKESLKNSKHDKKTEDDSGIKQKKAFLDLLLDQGGDLSDRELREEVDTFMFEGHDTTTVGISWSLFLLGLHPDIQNKIAEEVISVWPEGEPLTISVLNEMKYLERAVKESLRLYPSVPLIARYLQNDLQIGEYLVPAGTTLSIMIIVMHRNEEIFPEPDKFDPDRFLPENSAKRHPYAYIPFSAGPRNCIGQKFAMYEEKAILATILREFEVTSVQRREDVNIVADLVGRPENGISMKLKRREKVKSTNI